MSDEQNDEQNMVDEQDTDTATDDSAAGADAAKPKPGRRGKPKPRIEKFQVRRVDDGRLVEVVRNIDTGEQTVTAVE